MSVEFGMSQNMCGSCPKSRIRSSQPMLTKLQVFDILTSLPEPPSRIEPESARKSGEAEARQPGTEVLLGATESGIFFGEVLSPKVVAPADLRGPEKTTPSR